MGNDKGKHPQHEMFKQKSLAKMKGKKGEAKAQAFLDNLIEDCTVLRAQAEGMTKEQILDTVDQLLNTMTAEAAGMAKELAS